MFINDELSVKIGPMNRNNDKHPTTIIASCNYLNVSLLERAVCKHQPSTYLNRNSLDGSLSTIMNLLKDKLSNYEYEEIESEYKKFRIKYKSQKCLSFNNVDLSIYYTDYMLFARPRGFANNDYFDFELYNKESSVRDTFVDDKFRRRLSTDFNDNKQRSNFIKKEKFNEAFKEFIHRDWLNAAESTFEEFKEFVSKHEEFFAKPTSGSGGKGTKIIKTNSATLENLYLYCKEGVYLLEEKVIQHDALAKFNNTTLNTVRVLTFVDDDSKVHVLLGVARFGRKGNIVDNFHSGGVGAIVDVNTGRIISEAINQAHMRTAYHPDSNLCFIGFEYPCWKEIVEIVKKAALVMPKMRHVGWDFAVTKDGVVELIEGNSRSGFDVLQSPDQVGRKYLYDHLIPIEKKEPLSIDVTNMELKINNEINFKLISLSKKGKPRLVWDEVNGADEYYIYRAKGNDGIYRFFFATQKTSFVNISAVEDKTYYYKVIAFDSNKNTAISKLSEEVVITSK